MKVLLDTHALLWALRAPANLSPIARQIVDDPINELFVSAITPWEIATKHRIGKLPEAAPLLAAYAHHLEKLGAIELSLSTNHGLEAGRLVWENKDPFDRALAAQSMIENLPIITRDSAFATLPGIHTIW